MTRASIWAIAVSLLLPGVLAAQQRCEFRDEVELQGIADGNLEVDAGAGRLVIEGDADSGAIRVSAVLCASDEERLEALGVTLTGHRVETRYPNWRLGWGRKYARIDLTINVPADTRVQVEDGSGSIEISEVAGVEIDDGSGSLSVERVGSVVVEDSSGDLTIDGVAGDVDVQDGSGSVRIENVLGSVGVRDGSGGVEIRDVAGSVRVEDGNGNMTLENVGSVVVDDGSGSLKIRGVEAGVTIDDGSGSIEIEAVGRNVHIERFGSGRVTVHRVDGDLVVADGRRERIRYSEIGGTVELPPARRPGGSGG